MTAGFSRLGAFWRNAVLAIVFAWVLPASVRAQDATPAEPECISIEDGEGCLPVAAKGERVDVATPTFSDPTSITNPLFPISDLHSAILLGAVDGQLFRVEVTLLSEPKTIDIDGQPVEALVSQYVAYLDGQIHEVALDWYAQADDGSVWYLGEDVYNYEDGAVADTDGTWLAGRDGPAAMIMPADPKVGDVYRPENMPEVIFEEVTVQKVDVTVDGPRGPVDVAILTEELHQDAVYESKFFAPGYGEFLTSGNGDIEALALAVPTDALGAEAPAEVVDLYDGALEVLAAAEAGDFPAASTILAGMTASWATVQESGDVPVMIADQMTRALDALAGDSLIPAVNGADEIGTRMAAIDVARASQDILLQYRQPVEIDLARLGLWVQQARIDASITNPGTLLADVTTLEWTWDRIAHSVDQAAAGEVEAHIAELRTAAEEEDFEAAAEAADQLAGQLTELSVQ